VGVVEIAASTLEECGFSVKVATSAQGALDLLQREDVAVELIFSDIVMPGMNGMELAAEVKKRFPSIPVLLTTGYADTLRQARELGLPIVPKPYRPADLCSRVTALLEPGEGTAAG
jgi:CheY-like chemotaxis protein